MIRAAAAAASFNSADSINFLIKPETRDLLQSAYFAFVQTYLFLLENKCGKY